MNQFIIHAHKFSVLLVSIKLVWIKIFLLILILLQAIKYTHDMCMKMYFKYMVTKFKK
jgi:hypothetical protein